MDDLISREDALKALDEMSYKSPHESATSVVRKKHFGEILEKFIMQQPSAQKKGHWVDGKRMKMDGTFYWFRQCSACDYERNDDDSDKDTNFCPNCGADMRESE